MHPFAPILIAMFLFAMAWVTITILAIFISMGERRPPSRRRRNPFAEPVQNEFLTNSRRLAAAA